MGIHAIDHTGQKFGTLTVIRRVPNKSDRVRWLCRCECGREIEVYASNLNRYKSCGCKERPSGRKPVRVNGGEKYGHLTVIKSLGLRVYKSKECFQKVQYVLCQCDCGKEAEYKYCDLRSGRRTSCGCRGKDQEKINEFN